MTKKFNINTLINKLKKLNRKRNLILKKVKHSIRVLISVTIWDKAKRNTLNIKNVKTILFIRNEGTIGDLIICYPLLKNLYRSGYIVDMLLTKSNSCIMDHNPYIRNIYESDDFNNGDYLKKFRHVVPEYIMKELKSNKYDLIIDPSIDIPVHRLNLLNNICADAVISFNKWSLMKTYSKSMQFKSYGKHITDSINMLDNVLNYEGVADGVSDIYIPGHINEDVRKLLVNYGCNKIIVLNIYAGGTERCFSEDQLSAIILGINQSYKNVQMLVLDPDNEINLPLPDHVDIFPFGSIHHMVALIREAYLVISPDTSVVHISAVWKKNLIAVYKDVGENTILWAPGYDNASQIVIKVRSLKDADYLPSAILNTIASRHLLK